MLKIDVGCGATTRPGFLGMDVAGTPDVLCNVAVDPWPFDDASADHIYSSHCLEHIEHKFLMHVFKEMSRVAADGALIEIWHPHAFHSDAFVLGHVNYLSEAIYDHLGCTYRAFWKDVLATQWVLEEIRYSVESFVLEDIKSAGMEIEFAVCYLRDVIKEFGIFFRVDRTETQGPCNYQRFVCNFPERTTTIMRLSDGPRKEAL